MNARLSLALEGADAMPSSGRILVLNAGAAADLSLLPQDRVTIVQGFRPDHDALAARGYAVTPETGGPDGELAAAIVFLPRARAEARALVAEAARQVSPGGPVWVDGQKTDGIESMARDVRSRVAISAPVAKAHGKIFRFDAPDGPAFADWRAAESVPAPGFVTLPGMFSADKPDAGSALLAGALPGDLSGRGADLGAGWGWLSAQILAQGRVGGLHLVEANHSALACARRNIADLRAQFHWADVALFEPGGKLDFVVTNPPFHTTRAADTKLGEAFVRAAGRMLKPSGQMLMVANRHLPYETVLAETFRDFDEIKGNAGYKVLRAARPRVSPRSVAARN